MAESEGHRLTVEAIQIIASHGGQIERSELLELLEPMVDKERRTEKDSRNRFRWVVQLDSYSSTHAKDLIDKENLVWSLTDEGRQALQDAAASLPEEPDPADGDKEPDPTQGQLNVVIAEYIRQQDSKTGKWLENLVAALLRGMGYQHVTVSGKPGDGGVDVVAYKDKLGADLPRIKAQSKHYTKGQEISDADILRLAKTIHTGEIGLFVTSSSFSAKAQKCARESGKHIELIAIDRLVRLWVEHYPNMATADQELIPLRYELDTSRIKKKDDA